MTSDLSPKQQGSRRASAARTAAALGTATALACAVAWSLPTAPERRGTGDTRDAFAALVLSCPGGNTNSGTPDGGSPSQRPPLVQARAWASAGFAARFPAATPRAVAYGDGTLVLFREDDGSLRGALQYDGTGPAWRLTGLTYC